MGLIIWIAIGFAAGAIAKILTPQNEKGGWVSSIIIGIIGSMVGGFIANFFGLNYIFGRGIVGSLVIATGGSFLVLWVYHKFLADKLNLPL
ncbi:MAG: GlsB/YeaQ/YmgE family stress response membrane protein [Bacteroidota bacterium]